MNNQAYIQWEQSQLEPEQRFAPQGGRPKNKDGVHLWEDFKRMQDLNQQRLEDEMRRWERKEEGK